MKTKNISKRHVINKEAYKRFVQRKESDVGKSLGADRQSKAKTKVNSAKATRATVRRGMARRLGLQGLAT